MELMSVVFDPDNSIALIFGCVLGFAIGSFWGMDWGYRQGVKRATRKLLPSRDNRGRFRKRQ